MRLILITTLLFWLPFQFAWGAAASYCQHEQGSGTSHFGHHSHIHKQAHQGKVLQSSGESTPDQKRALADEDLDCDYCHLNCARLLAAVSLANDVEMAPHVLPSVVTSCYSPHIPTLIERPKWTLAV